MTVTRLAGRCLLGPLLLVVLAGCTEADEDASSKPRLARPARDTAAVTTRDHVLATRRLSARLLHAVPMPPGSRERSHSPTAYFRQASLGVAPSDPALERTTWWTVPLTRESFDTWLHSHVPRGLRIDGPPSGSVDAGSSGATDQGFSAPSAPAHTAARVNVAYTTGGLGLAVRVDTFISARSARTMTVPRDTASVTIRRTERSYKPHRRPLTTVRTVTAHRAVADLVGLVDGLPGYQTTPYTSRCPMAFRPGDYSMTFIGPHGTYRTQQSIVSACPSPLTLARAGASAPDRLDPGERFRQAADRYLG